IAGEYGEGGGVGLEGLTEYVTALVVTISTAIIGLPFVMAAWIVVKSESQKNKPRHTPPMLLWFTASSCLDALTYAVLWNVPPRIWQIPVFGTILSMF